VKRVLAWTAAVLGVLISAFGLMVAVVALFSMGGGLEIVFVGLWLVLFGVVVVAIATSNLRRQPRGTAA
jgi:hypothetical protein